MTPADGESYTVGAGAEPPGQDSKGWKRQRESFSCTDEIWERGKISWSAVRKTYLSWTQWLEAALEEKTQAVKAELGVEELPSAPDRLPTGRRTPAATPVGRHRRSFTCIPSVWAQARAAWWAQEEVYHSSWTDWVEEAIAEKAAKTEEPATTSTH